MEQTERLARLDALQKKLYAYACAENSLYLDAVTVAPKNTAEGRGVALGILAGEHQKLMTDPETKRLLDELAAASGSLDALHKREVELLRRESGKLARIPADEYMAYTELTNRASDVWHKAKENDDFASFCPVLQELVDYNRKFAGYYDAAKAPYDALLNEYERGVDTRQLDAFFETLRDGIVPLVRAISEKPPVDDSFLHLEYPVERQKAFADYIMEVMGIDRGHCGLGETEHPFTLEFNNKDVRITTHYDLHNVASSMYSVLHEGGHALYELGIRDDLQYTCLAGGVSMGVHESQSRFYENLIGRSRAFLEAIYPRVQAFFPEQLGGVSAEQFYRAVNKVEPSLIRTESDELTYCLHIMVRYEIEKQLIGGTLRAAYADAEYDEAKSSRDNKILLAFMPILYQNGGFKFLTMPNVGAGYGTYKRRALSGTYEADTLDFYYGLYNHAEYSIDVKVAELVTEAELNLQGAAMSKAEEDDGLNLDSNSSVSLEAGVGLKLRKRIQLAKERSLMLAIGAKYYHEFLDPYKDLRVGMDGSPVDFGIKAYDEDKNRLKTTAEAVYRDGDFAVAAEVSHNAEKESSIEGGLGVRYNF